jgi:outer membrane protein assembly factor BamB
MYQRTADHNPVIARPGFSVAWQANTFSKINGGMAVSGDVLYVDTFAGDLLAIRLSKGGLLWRAHVDNVLMSTPIVYKGLVYVGSGSNAQMHKGANEFEMARPEGDAVYAFDAQTGNRRWSFHTIGEDMPSPAVVRGVLVFANGDGHAYGLDPATGRLLWKQDLGGIATMASATPAGVSAIVSVCRVYRKPPYTCKTLALDPMSGKQRWAVPYGDSDATPTYGKGLVFLSGAKEVMKDYTYVPSYRARVAAVDATTGKVKWEYRDSTPGLTTWVGSRERAVAGTYANGLYVESLPGRNRLIAFDASTGKIRWQLQSSGPIKMSALIDGGRAYAGSVAGVLYTLRVSDGKVLGARPATDPYSTVPPILVGNTLVVAHRGTIEAIPLTWLR